MSILERLGRLKGKRSVSSETERREIDRSVPQHVAIILDGNRRWAEKRTE